MTTHTTERRPPLTRTAIVSTAVELADRNGIDDLTMRALAGELGYVVMSLYNHVANKDELVGLMVDEVAADATPPEAETEPLVAIRQLAQGMRAAFVAHPWAVGFWLSHLPGPHRTAQMELLLRLLEESGLPPDLAHHGFHAVMNHVLGYTLAEAAIQIDDHDLHDPDGTTQQYLTGLSEAEHPRVVAHIHHHLDGEASSSFDLVLDLIIDGLVRLADQR